MLITKPFVPKELEEDRKNIPIISIKLNEKNEEMLSIGMYALNMHSKSGVFKELADIGLKVILDTLGVERMNKLTSSTRRKLIPDKPKYQYYQEK